ncbi:unnamed protein product [Calicophoron daubneyi]|uniref:Uncharacterized protein n=1 Tax=Calicophoron daubneyi TaxID=300641 RepID=A0AAV2T6K1_CALDB
MVLLAIGVLLLVGTVCSEDQSSNEAWKMKMRKSVDETADAVQNYLTKRTEQIRKQFDEWIEEDDLESKISEILKILTKRLTKSLEKLLGKLDHKHGKGEKEDDDNDEDDDERKEEHEDDRSD